MQSDLLFRGVSSGALHALADAFRAGRLGLLASGLSINRVSPCPEPVVADLRRLLEEGMAPAHLALLLDAHADRLEGPMMGSQLAELVWTGPEGHSAFSRDTSVVVRELFERAKHSILLSTFVVHQGRTVFGSLAKRMDELPELHVQVFLHVGRGPRDTRYGSEILREFASEFRANWPGSRLPEVFYDPRALASDPRERATWHAKCVVVDDSVAFVTSANFTEWAQHRNVEAGVLVRDARVAVQLSGQFKGLVDAQLVRRVPGL